MKLETVREGINLSQWDLFVKTGVHTSQISLIEKGYCVASEEDKGRLSKALGVEVDTIEWPTDENNGKWRWR